MKRWGDGDRFLERIARIRSLQPDAAFRSNFIVGYPGETEADHDQLLRFVEDAQLDWCGFFAFSPEDGTYAATLDQRGRPVTDGRTAGRVARAAGSHHLPAPRRVDRRTVTVLVDEPGQARSHREAPEIDGIIEVPKGLAVGGFHTVTITEALGPDLVAG